MRTAAIIARHEQENPLISAAHILLKMNTNTFSNGITSGYTHSSSIDILTIRYISGRGLWTRISLKFEISTGKYALSYRHVFQISVAYLTY